jgi:hypothetical protein
VDLSRWTGDRLHGLNDLRNQGVNRLNCEIQDLIYTVSAREGGKWAVGGRAPILRRKIAPNRFASPQLSDKPRGYIVTQ